MTPPSGEAACPRSDWDRTNLASVIKRPISTKKAKRSADDDEDNRFCNMVVTSIPLACFLFISLFQPFCTECGAKVEGKFCPSCGAKQVSITLRPFVHLFSPGCCINQYDHW